MQHVTTRFLDLHRLWILAALSGGCLAEADSAEPAQAGAEVQLDADLGKAAARQLRCVASPQEDGAAIWRLSVSRASTGGYQLQASRERQFAHDLDLSGRPIPESVVVDEEAFTARASGTVGTRTINLSFAQGSIELSAKSGYRGNLYAGTASLSNEANLSITCWGSWFTPEFRYQPDTGACVNGAGLAGKNALPIEMIRETGNGECASFAGVLNDRDFGYPVLRGWDLRGVDFADVDLSFGIMVDADLRGARFDTIGGGYYVMTGTVDSFSQHNPSCTLDGAKVYCTH